MITRFGCRIIVELYECLTNGAPNDPRKWTFQDKTWSPQSERIRYIDTTEPLHAVQQLIETYENSHPEDTSSLRWTW